jgi:hypothetical protein
MALFGAVLGLSACAGTPDEAVTVAAAAEAADGPKERMICRTEKIVGSNRPERICRSASQVERDRERARTMRNRTTNGEREAPSGQTVF